MWDCLCAFVNDYYTWLGRAAASSAAASSAVAAAAIHRIFASVRLNDTTIVQNLWSDWSQSLNGRVSARESERAQAKMYYSQRAKPSAASVNKGIKYAGRQT